MNTSITSDILAVEMCVTRLRKDASDDLREVSAVSISLGMVGKVRSSFLNNLKLGTTLGLKEGVFTFHCDCERHFLLQISQCLYSDIDTADYNLHGQVNTLRFCHSAQ